MTHEQIASLSMPQLLIEIAPREDGKGNRPVSAGELKKRQEAAQDRVFADVCNRGHIRPATLALMLPEELERRVRQVLPPGASLNVAALPAQAAAFAERRKESTRATP